MAAAKVRVSYPVMKFGLLPLSGRVGATLLVALAGARFARGQPSEATAPPAYTAAELDQLLGPIALYPDPLVALILPASAAPADIVSAASYVAAKGDPYDAGSQPWSESVKALAHYPEVVEWMAENLTWVQAVGAAFVSQPSAVMESIQRLRQRARNLGTLVNGPQQQVVEEDGLIEILPTDADVIYVPRYDPSVVYLEEAEIDGGSYLGFGTPYHAGFWLTYGFDWRRQALLVGRFSRDGQGWRRPDFFSQDLHAWHPPAHPALAPARALPPGQLIVRPSLLAGAPPAPPAPPAGSERRAQFPPGASQRTEVVPVGQRPIFQGTPTVGPPGGPATAEWQRAREQQEREAREKAEHPGILPTAMAHPAASPPKPPPPSPAPASATSEKDAEKR